MNFDGTPSDLPAEAELSGPSDHLYLRFSGLVENEGDALRSVERLVAEMKKRVRLVTHETDLLVIEGISAHPAAKKFLRLLENRKPEETGAEYPVWKRAREMGLLKIKEIIEAGS